MIAYIYDWIQNITFFMVLTTIALHVIPNNNYKKYLKFFTGLLLVVMLADPLFTIFGIGQNFVDLFNNISYQQELQKIEESTRHLEGININQYLPLDEQMEVEVDEDIRIEEIRIGE